MSSNICLLGVISKGTICSSRSERSLCREEITPRIMWDSIHSLLPKAAGKYNFAASLKAIEVCQAYRNIAKEILPEDALKNTFPKSYVGGAFTVGVLNSAWAEKLQQNKHRIHQSLRKKFGERAIKNVKIEMAERLPSEEPAGNPAQSPETA